MILRRRASTLVACGATLLGACTTDTEVTEFTPVPIVATTSIWADIASTVACGEPVVSLIPAGADPHTFEPSLRDRELIDGPAAIIANGMGLEGPVSALLESVEDPPFTTVFEMSDAVTVIEDDPHIWQDPTLVAETLDTIAGAALAVDRDPIEIETCTDGYRAELLALDAEITSLLSPIPTENRVMVTSHDSLEYFARRYGIEILGAVIPSINTLAESNAADLAALAELIAERNVSTIFTEQLESTNDAEALADRLGVRVVPLVTDALTTDPDSDTYIEMMRSNAAAIAGALAP
jgi:zinc/manganese transport system substrate-binding protein